MKKKWMSLRSKYKAPLGFAGILLLLGLAFSYAMFQGGFVSWFLFYSVLPFVLYSIMMAFYPADRLSARRTISKEMLMAGEELTVTISIKKKSNFPLFYMVIEDLIPDALQKVAHTAGNAHQQQSRVLLFPLFKKEMTFTYKIEPAPRGVFELDAIALKTGDLFGFVHRKAVVKTLDKVFVYPRYQEIERWEVGKMLQSGSKQAGRRSMTDYTSTVSVREYAPGDRMAWLHWKASARSNKLLTKVFEHQRNDDFCIVLDQSAKSYGRHTWLFERAVSFAASLSHYSISKGGAIGLENLEGGDGIAISSGVEQQWRILHALAKVEPEMKDTFDEVLKRHFLSGSLEGKTAVIISSRLDEVMVRILEMAAVRNANILFFFIAADMKLSALDLTLLNRLNHASIPATAIIGPDFSESLKAGVTYATV
ncbi:DUF58 domain-containing protein [Fictibacillus aquaticus]|uniref:DUF58 domain-containing protein n=1 Tax=Fictibacillus aquaticus TaxID=2021314 RepID=A0A235F575_9BACL|nr:DUF58 domain-containing protein [Fictibacillus aquaticus]OYD56368.1 hypothetical protein CGZ90_17590 [Fictibacillus aquaticus]